MAGSESTVGALLDETGGSIKTGPFGTKLKASEYTATGVPVISVGEVGFGRLRVHHDTPRVDDTVSSRMPEYLLKAGDIVFGRKGAVERSAQVQPDEDGYFLGSDGIRIRLNVEECDPKFISYQLQTTAHRSWMIQHAAGTTMPSLNEGIIRRIPIVLKPLAEQKAIAAVLGALDDKIELNRRMNAKLEELARTLFQSWFVDFEPVRAKLDGREPVGLDSNTAALFPQYLDNSTLGIIPKGWQVNRISEVVEEVFDGPHATPPHVEEGPIFLGIKNLTGSALALSDTRYISESDWPRWTKRVTPKPLDIVFSYEATLGFFALIPPGLRCCLGRRLALIRPRAEDGHSHFWFHQFIGPDFQRYLIQHSVQGATVDRIPLIQFPNYFVLNPPSALKEAFECRVAPLWAKIHTNAKQSRTLATLRDTLLPKLLSGELSVETTKN
jgi:type I restriction enzyme S subunit